MRNKISWDSLLDKLLTVPGCKISRNEYLQEAFSNYGGDIDLLCKMRPVDVYGPEIIDKVAEDAITNHLYKTTGISVVTGLPGGYALFGTIPADIVQFYYHVLVLAQKLGYIYGWIDFYDDMKVNEGTRNVLTVFIGVMLGSQSANKVLSEIAKNFSKSLAKRISKLALTKTFYYPIIKQICKWVGTKMTKDIFAKNVSKLVPILGGLASGGITYFSFRTMAHKLKNELEKQMHYFQGVYSHSVSDIEDVEFEEDFALDFDFTIIQACINIALADSVLEDSEEQVIIEMIEDSDLNSEKKNNLLSQMKEHRFVDIDFSPFREKKDYAISLVENLFEVVNVDGIRNKEEDIYMFKILSELNLDWSIVERIIRK